MASPLTISLTGLDQLQRMQALLQPELFLKAQQGGIAYAAKAVPPLVAKTITATYNISSARIKQDISGVRFSSDNLSATIAFSRRPPTLVQFRPNPGKRGPQPGLGRGLGWGPANPPGKPLTAAIIRGQRQTFPGAFITTGASGNQVVLRRTPTGLKAVYGPSIGSIALGDSAIHAALEAALQQRMAEQYQKGFERVLAAATRGYG